MYRPAVSVLTFHVAFTQPNCPARNSPLLTFKLRNLLPFCRSCSVGSVTVLSAVLKSNRNVCCLGALVTYVTSKSTLIYTVQFCRLLGASLRTYEIFLYFSRDHGGKIIAPVDWLSLFKAFFSVIRPKRTLLKFELGFVLRFWLTTH